MLDEMFYYKDTKEYKFLNSEGTERLNDYVINLRQDRIGYVPLSNLLPEVKGMKTDRLFKILEYEGAKVKLVEYPDGDQEVLVKIG